MISNFSTFSILISLLLGAAWCIHILRSIRRKHFPPGPQGLPLFENFFDLPAQNPWVRLAQWKDVYGDMCYLKVTGIDLVILNSVEAAKSTLSEKGAIYCDRVSLTFLGKLGGWGDDLILMNDGPRLRSMRRLFAKWLGAKNAIERFGPVITSKICQQYLKIVDDHSPKAIQQHLRTLAGSIILDVTYGYPVQDTDDKLLPMIETTMLDSAYFVIGSNIVDVLPWVEHLPSWMPGTGYRAAAAEVKARHNRCMDVPFLYTKAQMATGTSRPSVVASVLEESQDLSAEEEEIVKHTAIGMFSGGADTSVSFMCTFFILMALHPDIQAKAQAEIDSVVGSSRLPKLSDRGNLSYTNALVEEVLRYAEITPLGAPRVLREDDVHNGHFVPKGAWMVPNIWAMSRDPLVYDQPNVFNPERFIGDRPEASPLTHVFGFGRRICPGMDFASSAIFLECATALMTLNIGKAKDEKGIPIEPVLRYRGAVLRHPEPAPCEVTARSMHALELLRANSADCY